uniref:Acyltransferase n=1 Tax=Panagrolaimus sp. ES5 TaxID=591445 RepID=A0AC34FEH7_9BILA
MWFFWTLPQLAVAFYIFIFIISPIYITIISTFFILFPPLWGIAIPYYFWYQYDRDTPRRGGRTIPCFRRLPLWHYFAQYFSARLIKTAELPANRNYMFGCHPHGVLCFGTYISFGTEATHFSQRFPGLHPHMVTLPIQFRFPIRRELFLAAGIITSDPDSIEYVLNKKEKGQVICVVPGGAEEALDCHQDNYDLTLNKRKGFIRLAIKNNTALVPVYCFNENMTYMQFPNPKGSYVRNLQCLIKDIIGFAPTVFAGTGFFNRYVGFMPFPAQITTVVGAPIDTPYHPNPPQELIDKVHQEYIKSLINLFEQHKARYGLREDVELRIV